MGQWGSNWNANPQNGLLLEVLDQYKRGMNLDLKMMVVHGIEQPI